MSLIRQKINHSCLQGSSKLLNSDELLLDLGLQPVSNRFLPVGTDEKVPRYPIELCVSCTTGLIHLGKTFPVKELTPRYNWLTCFEPEDHLDDLTERLIQLPGISHESVFGAYSFKDDSTLRRLKDRGYDKVWRIDPIKDLDIIDRSASVETYQSVFTSYRADRIRSRYGAADVFIVRHVIEHAFNLYEFIQAIRQLIKPNGYIVWELPDCERALVAGDCTMIWEEHVYYFTRFTIKQLLERSGFNFIHYESVPYPLENSIIAIVQNAQESTAPFEPDYDALAKELSRARRYSEVLSRRRLTVRHKLETMRREYGPIALFGAGHLSVAFLSLMNVSDLISCVMDDNPNKKGMRMPSGNMEIVDSEALYAGNIGVCLLSLNPQNHPIIRAKHQRFTETGGQFFSIFPGSDMYIEKLT
jgi:hypothetical protein